MTVDGAIVDELPVYTPDSAIRVAETMEFVGDDVDGEFEPQTVYGVQKSPFERLHSVTAIHNGIERELDVGSDVVATDETDGQYRSIEFLDTYPDRGTEFTVEYVAEPIILRFVETFDEDIFDVGSVADEIQRTRGFENASGQRLDLLGSMFGDIGRRLGRDDTEYRSYLLSVATAFSATGTLDDIKFVAAGALGISQDEVTVTEDTERVGFEVKANNVDDAVFVQSVNELLEEASAAGVELLGPPVLATEGATVSVSGIESTVTSREDGLGSGELS